MKLSKYLSFVIHSVNISMAAIRPISKSPRFIRLPENCEWIIIKSLMTYTNLSNEFTAFNIMIMWFNDKLSFAHLHITKLFYLVRWVINQSVI